MKKLLLIAIVLIPQLLSAQLAEDEIYRDNYDAGNEHEFVIEDTDAELIVAKQKHIQLCMDKFANQQKNGIFLSILGGGGAILGVMEENKTISYVGAGIGLIGFIVRVDSYKWLNRASLEPTRDGATFKFKF